MDKFWRTATTGCCACRMQTGVLPLALGAIRSLTPRVHSDAATRMLQDCQSKLETRHGQCAAAPATAVNSIAIVQMAHITTALCLSNSPLFRHSCMCSLSTIVDVQHMMLQQMLHPVQQSQRLSNVSTPAAAVLSNKLCHATAASFSSLECLECLLNMFLCVHLVVKAQHTFAGCVEYEGLPAWQQAQQVALDAKSL